MNLPFSTHWPDRMPEHLAGRPTYFPEKIWQSIPDDYTTEHFEEYSEGFDKINYRWHLDAVDLLPKIHTIRRDNKNQWKEGMLIDFWINMRSKKQFRFAPKILVKSIQKIEITYNDEVCESNCSEPTILIDERPLNIFEMEKLAVNDGFDDVVDFLAWFNEDFSGSLINWTDFKY